MRRDRGGDPSSSAKTAAMSPAGGSACIRRPRAAISRKPVLQRRTRRPRRPPRTRRRCARSRRRARRPRAPQLGEGVLEREERGLRVSRLVEQRRRLRLAEHDREQRPVQERPQTPRIGPGVRGRPAACRRAAAHPGYCAPCPVKRNAIAAAPAGHGPPQAGGALAAAKARNAWPSRSRVSHATPAVRSARARRRREATSRAAARARRQVVRVAAPPGRPARLAVAPTSESTARVARAACVARCRPALPRGRRARWCRRSRRSSRPRRGARRRRSTARPASRLERRVRHRDVRVELSKCRCGGTSSCSRHSTTLIRPATPAAASRWPMLVLTEPTQHAPLGRALPKTAPSAATSIGSPSGVPVPCAST